MPWLTSGRHPPLVGQPGSWGAAEVPDAGRHPRAARSGPSPVRNLCVHAGLGRPDSPWPRRPRTHPVRPPDLLGPNGEAGAHCATRSGAGARGTSLRGRRGCGAGRRSLGAEPQLCILITGNHRWLAAPPAVGGRRTSTRLSFSSSHHPRSYLLPLPERRGPQRARAPVSCCTWGHRGPGSRRTLPRTGHGAGRAAAGVGLSWFEPSPGHRPARDLELIP